jgi:hypothetical protein
MAVHCYGRLHHQLSLLAGHGMFLTDEDIVEGHLCEDVVILATDPATLGAATSCASSPSTSIVTLSLDPLRIHIVQHPRTTWPLTLIEEG